VNYFLGIKVSHLQNNAVHLCQAKYIKELLSRAKMLNARPVYDPMLSSLRLSSVGAEEFEDPHLYRSIVGGLQYATVTRPDIAFSVNKVCQFMHRPLAVHWVAVKRILRYLAGTIDHGMLIKKSEFPLDLVGFCDADWASDPDDRRSTSGYCIFYGGNLILWKSKKQTTVSRSSTEAEFRSLAELVAEIIWVQSLLFELCVSLKRAPVLWCDNISALMVAANPVLHSRTKHFELDLYFVREKALNKAIDLRHVPSADQLADCLSKAISKTRFIQHRSKLTVDSLRGDVK
jgi:histone deacetylase 1/2